MVMCESQEAGAGGGQEHPERGSSVAETAMIMGLVALLFVGMIQLAVFLHWRNMAADAATHGARFGAFPDQSAGAGAQRAQELLDSSLQPGMGQANAELISRDYGPAVKVTVIVRVPILGFLPAPLEYSTNAVVTKATF